MATGGKWQSQGSNEVCIPAERQLLTLCHGRLRHGGLAAAAQGLGLCLVWGRPAGLLHCFQHIYG